MTADRWTSEGTGRLGGGVNARRVRWRAWRVRAMRRSRRVKSMARLSRTLRHLAARLWRAAPWLLMAGMLLSTSLLAPASERVEGGRWWAAIVCALAAPVFAIILEPPRRHHPSQRTTFVAYLVAIAAAAYVVNLIVVPQTNSFYSIALVTEGTLLLYALHVAQAAMRRISPAPATAAPRAADALIDGVRVLLLAFVGSTAVAWRPVAAVAFVLALGFAILALILRAPGALAQLVRTRA